MGNLLVDTWVPSSQTCSTINKQASPRPSRKKSHSIVFRHYEILHEQLRTLYMYRCYEGTTDSLVQRDIYIGKIQCIVLLDVIQVIYTTLNFIGYLSERKRATKDWKKCHSRTVNVLEIFSAQNTSPPVTVTECQYRLITFSLKHEVYMSCSWNVYNVVLLYFKGKPENPLFVYR